MFRRFIAKFVQIQFGWVGCGPWLRCAHPRTPYASPHSPPAKLDSNLAPRGKAKPVGLIESFGSPSQTPGRLHRKNIARGSAPRPCWGSTPNPTALRRGSGTQHQRGSGDGAPSNILAAKPPRGLGRGPNRRGPPPPPPPSGYATGITVCYYS